MHAPLPLARSPYTRVDQILGNLDALDAVMYRNGDLRAVFLIAYRHITEHVLRALPSGRFEDPEWVTVFTLEFANRYRAALVAWEDGALDDVPAEWRSAFDYTRSPDGFVLQHLLLGMTAHILRDLPMAVATTVGGRDSTVCLRDFLRVLQLLHTTVDLIQDDIGERYGPGLSLLDYTLLRVDEWLSFWMVKYYRRVAWDAAVGYLSLGVEDTTYRAKMQGVAEKAAAQIMWLGAGPRRAAFWKALEAADPSRMPYVGWLYPGVRRDTRVRREGNTLHLRFRRYLRQSPEQIFPLLSEPDLMNLWSEAPVRLVAPGDGGGGANVGAVRQVRVPVPGPAVLLDEVTETYAPPYRYVYRVTRCDQIGHHRGEMTLRTGGRGTEVQWEVQIAAPTGLSVAMLRQILVPKLQASLDQLERVAADVTWTPSPPDRRVEDGADLPALQHVIRDQGQRAGALLVRSQHAGPAVSWFLKLIEAASYRIARAADDGHWGHPSWVLRCWVATQGPVLTQLAGHLSGASGQDAAWQACFKSVAAQGGGRLRPPWTGVIALLRQQLVADYPAAVDATWRGRYAGRCDAVRFRADELSLSALVGELLWAVARAGLGLSGSVMRASERVLAPEMIQRGREQLLAGYAKARRRAFEDAAAGLLAPPR